MEPLNGMRIRQGAVAVSIRKSGAMPLENFPKINFEIAYFFAFLHTGKVSSAMSAKLSIRHYCYLLYGLDRYGMC